MKKIVLIFLFFLVVACSSSPETKSTQTNNKSQNWQQGTVIYLDFEGGFYGIETKQGKKLLPLNLSKIYQVTGKKISFIGLINNDVITIHQWGQPFTIKKIKDIP